MLCDSYILVYLTSAHACLELGICLERYVSLSRKGLFLSVS